MGLPFDGKRTEGRGAHVEFVIEIGVGVAAGGVVDSGAGGEGAADGEENGVAIAGIDLRAEDGGDGLAIGGVDGEATEAALGDQFPVYFGEEDADDGAFELGVRRAGATLVRAELFDFRVHVVGDEIGQAESEALVILGTDVDAVVETEIDGGHHADFGDAGFEFALGFLDHVPFGLIGVADVAADLDVIERQIGLEEILAEGGDQFFEFFREGGDYLWIGVGFALIPEDAADAGASGEEAAVGGAVEGVALFVLEGRAPLIHGSAAVGARDEADGDAGALEHELGEGEAEARALFAGGDVGFQFLAFELFGVAVFIFAPVDAVGGGDQEGERFGGDDPAIGLIEGADARVGLFDIDEIADAIHIGLAGEEPEIADEEVLDRIERGGTGDADLNGIGATLGDALEGAGPGVVLDAFESLPVEAG